MWVQQSFIDTERWWKCQLTLLIEIFPLFRLIATNTALNHDLTTLKESRRRDLNPRPADYESAAIPLSHDGTLCA